VVSFGSSKMVAHSVWRLAVYAAMSSLVLSGAAASGRGVMARLSSLADDKKVDFAVLPNFELYVPASQPPSPFLGTGPFQSELMGEVRVARRDEFRFSIEASGSVRLFVNEALLLESESKEATSKPIQLNRGYNGIRLSLKSPETGDTFIRLRWESQGVTKEPLPERFLKFTADDPAFAASQLRLQGRALFIDHRCGHCHSVEAGPDSLVMDENDGPSFVGIGSRRQKDWLTKWILDPRKLREHATMPSLLHSDQSSEDAAAIAGWLSQQKIPDEPIGSFRNGDVESGRQLVESLHCSGCHRLRDTENGGEVLIDLDQIDSKFLDGSLVAFLLNPSRHFESIRMPDFLFSVVEAEDIAAFLVNESLSIGENDSPEKAIIGRGKSLVQSTGCLHCHKSAVPNLHQAKPLRLMASASWETGCLAERPRDNNLPRYSLSPEQRNALAAFGRSKAESSLRYVGYHDASREIEKLNCRACHGTIETVPELALIGEKLKPEWSASILDGTLSYKPRPWIEARMPSFGKRGERIAEGMAMLNGLPPRSEGQKAMDPDLAEIGRQLVSANGGFACVTCHAVGPAPATAVFESAGINFAYANERLQRDFFHRWVMNPTQIDPESKMPVYFSDGESPLLDVLSGSADSQINAIWEYFKQGFDINPPE
jgi:mono/diheme cytochrome c family protein